MAKKSLELREGETLFAENVTGDCWKMPSLTIGRQISGKYHFTDKRVAFFAKGLVGTDKVSWEIELKDIAAAKTCTTPPFFPFGILITMKNGDKYKLSILKRKKYFEWLKNHIA